MLNDLRYMRMDVEQAAYAEQDTKNLPVFRDTMKEVTYSEEQLAEFRKVAGQPVWDAWIEANKDKFDAQGVFDAIFEYAKEAEAK